MVSKKILYWNILLLTAKNRVSTNIIFQTFKFLLFVRKNRIKTIEVKCDFFTSFTYLVLSICGRKSGIILFVSDESTLSQFQLNYAYFENIFFQCSAVTQNLGSTREVLFTPILAKNGLIWSLKRIIFNTKFLTLIFLNTYFFNTTLF